MSLASEIFTAEQIDELYKAGFAIVRRPTDPLEVPAVLIHPDWSYQWNLAKPDEGVKDIPQGWVKVNYEDHPGWFAPDWKLGPVTVQGMVLCKKRKDQVEAFQIETKRKSLQLLEGWADRFGMFTGGATVLQTDGEDVIRTEVAAGKGVTTKTETYERPTTKTVELVSKIPMDMVEYIDAIFAERDAIRDKTVRADRTLDPDSVITRDFYAEIERDKGAPWWPTLNAIILPYAIEAVRHRLKESAS